MELTNLNLPERDLKNLIKIALEELIKEKPELFRDLIAEVIEDMALGKAIKEGLKTPEVREEEVFKVLKD